MEERKTDHVKIWFGRDGEGAVLCILKIIIERGGGEFSHEIISITGESLNTPHFFASPLGT